MLDEDIGKVMADDRLIKLCEGLDSVRTGVLVEMAYQLGISGLLKFAKMHAAIRVNDFVTAHSEGLDSVWAEQTPNRALRLMTRMRTGVHEMDVA
jgi:lysozyme